MSIRYAKYAKKAFRVGYIGRKQRNNCLKTIQLEREWQYVRARLLLFSPDGTRVLSDSGRGICIWDATSGESITGPLDSEDNEDAALSVAYLPDGRFIIVASDDGVIRKWDLFNNCLVWERVMSGFHIDMRRAESATFSPDRKSVVFGDDGGTIRVWGVDTGEQDGEPLERHTDDVKFVSFSPDSKYLASGSYDTTTIIWDMDKRGTKTGPLRRHTGAVTAVEFSPCGTNVVSGSEDWTILIWNAFTGEMMREIICKSGVYSVAHSPNGLFILAGGEGWMGMWDYDTAAPKVFQVDRDIDRVSFSSDGSRFASVSDSPYSLNDKRMIQIWDASWGVGETKAAFEENGWIESISLSPSGEFIVSTSYEGKSIFLWDLLNGECVKNLKLSSHVRSVAFSPINEQLIAFGLGNGTVQVWNVTNDVPVKIGNHRSSVLFVAFSPSDGQHVASGSTDNTICIWDIGRRELAVGPLTGHADFIWTLAYSPDGTRLVSGSNDRTIRIWNSVTSHLLSTLNGHFDSVNSVAYSPDGSRIVSGSNDDTILVWDSQSGQIVCGPITGHENFVNSVCFSPDGKRILSGSRDNTARVWDAMTGNPLFPPFRGHTDWVTFVCSFPDGRHFATGSKDGTIRIWTLDTIPNDTDWELRNDNWVVGENGELMMWIPTDLHRHLCGHRNVTILNHSFYLKLHFNTE